MQEYIYLSIFFSVIGALIIFKLVKTSKMKKNLVVAENINKVKEFIKVIEEAKTDYFTYPLMKNLKQEYKVIYEFFCRKPYANIKNTTIFEFKELYNNLEPLVKQWNEEFVNRELERNKDIFDNIDGKSLDMQQRRAVVVDEASNLVLAGAGSGKTLTISAKVKYLVNRKNISPEEILLISFTRKAAEEMHQRISQKLGIDVEAKKFHKLGLDIITKDRNVRPDIAEELRNVIDSYFKDNIKNNKNQIQSLVMFFGYYLNIPKDLEEFENLGECHDFYRNVDFETIKGKIEKQREVDDEIKRLKVNKQTLQGETVKSLEELIIANFLFLNGINYIYEYKYPFESEDKYRKHYRPDFYLPDYDIYIEHFGITKDNKVPRLSEIEEKKYLDGIKWKRETHIKNKTILIETYSYYNKEGILLAKLEEKLKQHEVEIKEFDFKEIYSKVFDKSKDTYFVEFKKLIASFIGLFKSNGYSVESFTKLKDSVAKIENTFLRQRSSLFLDIVKPIYIKYKEFIEDNGMIDFNDMINEATNIVKENDVGFKYKYIIIDEYQDISMSRFNLIREIRNQTNAKVMCVGDDWQSIYRFTGSDIDLFTSFGKYLGYYELLKIENTYRNSQELINIAGNFIMKNPKQLKKNLNSLKHHSNPIRMITYDGEIYQALTKAIEEIVYLFGNEAQIKILGRNNFDIDIIEKDQGNLHKEFKLLKTKEQVLVQYKKYPKLNINFFTAHRSKGLEADNVIIINLENKLVGFPNKISDDPILSLVLTDLDKFDFAEERRLFYVALTRTKNTTYLITPTQRPSVFCEELMDEFKINNQPSNPNQASIESPNCPRCQKGHLVIRENKEDNNKFLGCSNYPFCDLTFKQVEIINDQVKCNICGGYMVKRPGKYGEFYGCTNYPYCNNTLKIDNEHSFNKSDTQIKNEVSVNTKFNTIMAEDFSSNSQIKNNYKHIKNEKKNVNVDNIDQRRNNVDYKGINMKSDKTSYGQEVHSSKDHINKIRKQCKEKNIKFIPNSLVIHNEFGKGKVISNDLKIIKVEFQNRLVISFSYETCVNEGIIRDINSAIDCWSVSKLFQVSDEKFKNKEFDRDAIIINDKIIKIKKDSLKHYFRLAECYKQQNLFDEAIEIYNHILRIDKNNSEAKNNLSYLKGLCKTVYKEFMKNDIREDYY